MPLAHLSQHIVDAILEGRQPVEVTTRDLLNCINMLLYWNYQAPRLSFR